MTTTKSTTPSTTLHLPNNKKPLAILAGWLGCQPHHLKRYEALYHDAGWHVISRIASPSLIARSSFSSNDDDDRRRRLLFPLCKDDYQSMAMMAEDLRRDVERRTTISSPSTSTTTRVPVIFHSFSNGGCFLWEELRRLLKNDSDSETNGNKSHTHRQYFGRGEGGGVMVGLVFDSSPAAFDESDEALIKFLSSYIATSSPSYTGNSYGQTDDDDDDEDQSSSSSSPLSSNTVGPEHMIISSSSPLQQQQQTPRGRSFWNGFRNDTSPLPQLYIYSRNDTLTNASCLEELISYRQNRFGSDRIWSLRMDDDSPHCGHLMRHPEEYRGVMKDFLAYCCLEMMVQEGERGGRSRL